jgi:hypothetical protein
LSVPEWNGLAFFYEVIREAIDATFGELLAARLAGVLVAIARIFEFGSAIKELEDELIRFATHRLQLYTRRG